MKSITLAAVMGLLSNDILSFGRGLIPSREPTLYAPRGKTRPKVGASNPLRGYYAKYSNVLTPMGPEINYRNAANRNKLKRERRAGR